MKIIWTFTLLMIPGVVSSMSVTGYSGGGVNITCRYDKGYSENKKYFCKGQWSECTDRIKTDIKDKWVKNDRFSLYDDTSSAVFTVTIRDLREEDSGTYHCGTDIPYDIDLYTEVRLKVITVIGVERLHITWESERDDERVLDWDLTRTLTWNESKLNVGIIVL